MSATKEQEHKALEKIKKIVSELGENSYLLMAFDGCFEIAESEIKELKDKIECLSEKNTTLQNRLNSLKEKIVSNSYCTIAMPLLGTGTGKLDKHEVYNTISKTAMLFPDLSIYIYINCG